jgi:hypothetical protein
MPTFYHFRGGAFRAGLVNSNPHMSSRRQTTRTSRIVLSCGINSRNSAGTAAGSLHLMRAPVAEMSLTRQSTTDRLFIRTILPSVY